MLALDSLLANQKLTKNHKESLDVSPPLESTYHREWKSGIWDRNSSKKLNTTVHQASALEQFLSVRAAPTASYTALLQVLLCTACKASRFPYWAPDISQQSTHQMEQGVQKQSLLTYPHWSRQLC